MSAESTGRPEHYRRTARTQAPGGRWVASQTIVTRADPGGTRAERRAAARRGWCATHERWHCPERHPR